MTAQQNRVLSTTIGAARAKVSIATVLLALRGDPRCTASTVTRVIEAAIALHELLHPLTGGYMVSCDICHRPVTRDQQGMDSDCV